ncbi:MAG: hypothetical protein AAFX54_05350 [Pseudomonadota bacterium]
MMSDENEKPGEETPQASSETPEVEAEIVTDAELADADADTGEAFDDADEPTPAPKPRKSTLTPGVILFIAFAVIALIIFTAWRFQEGRSVAISDAPSASAPDQAEEAIDEMSVGGDDGQGAPAEDEPASPPAASKISNETVAAKPADLAPRDALENFDENAPPLPSPPSDESATDGNLGLQAAAKEAFLSADDGEAVEPEDDDNAESADDAPAFEIEPSSDESEDIKGDGPDDSVSVAAAEGADPALDEDITSDAVDEEPDNDLGTDDVVSADAEYAAADMDVSDDAPIQSAQKINNDLEAVKESFRAEIASLETALAEERENGAALREQIEEMRRNFQAALAARDRSASRQAAELNARLEKLENGGGVEAGRRAAAALALSAVARATDNGEPFADELEVLAGYIPQGREIATLRRYSDTELPTAAQLEEAFLLAARDALAADGRDEAAGMFGKLSARAGNLISIRPAEPTAGDSAQAVISRAESFVDAGDIAAGVAELDALPDAARAGMADWVTLASSRVAVDQAIASLSQRLSAPVR